MSVEKVGSIREEVGGEAGDQGRLYRGKGLPGLVPWFGGKGNQAAKLADFVPASRKYVEPYGGGASLLMRLVPRSIEVYNDLDGNLINLCRVLQNRRQSAELRRRLAVTFHSRDEFRRALRILASGTARPVDRAWAFFVRQVQGFSGMQAVSEGSWATSQKTSTCGRAQRCSTWWSRVEKLAAHIERMSRVQIESRCALEVLQKYDDAETVFYLDPPYVHATRAKGSRDEYAFEQPDEHHRQLVELLLTLKGKVLLSGYASDLYRPLEEAGWNRVDYEVACFAEQTRDQKRGKRTESVWLNFEPPALPKGLAIVKAADSFALAA